jgi:hypothetical protein
VAVEHAFGVDVAFDDGWAEVFVSHDNKQVSRVSQVVEDLLLKEEKIRVDVAFSKSCLQVDEELSRRVFSMAGMRASGASCGNILYWLMTDMIE